MRVILLNLLVQLLDLVLELSNELFIIIIGDILRSLEKDVARGFFLEVSAPGLF